MSVRLCRPHATILIWHTFICGGGHAVWWAKIHGSCDLGHLVSSEIIFPTRFLELRLLNYTQLQLVDLYVAHKFLVLDLICLKCKYWATKYRERGKLYDQRKHDLH